MKIDAHQHFWKYDSARHSWINEEMIILKQNYLPPDLKPVLKTNEMDGCIAIQADQSEEETDFLISCAQQHDFIRGVVGWTDLKARDVDDRLAYYAQEAVVKGFRHIIQDEPDPDFILNKQFQKGLKLFRKYDFTYDILIYLHQMEAVLKVVEQNPYQKFVIDHIAKPDIKQQSIAYWKKCIIALAKHENVYCKVSGMVTEADWKYWKIEDFKPYLDSVFESFGPARTMYGSDWPVCLVAGKYNEVKNIVTHYIQNLALTEQDQVMGLTAKNFYNIKHIQ